MTADNMQLSPQLMLDIETLGSKPGSVIVSIGAVVFSDKGCGDEFYAVIDAASAQAAGLTIDASTVMWWLTQSEEARAALKCGQSLESALAQLSHFVLTHDIKGVWGNGATFDNVLVRHAYEAVGQKCPWSYRVDKCYRTLYNLYPNIPLAKRSGAQHNSLDDARFQADHAVQILARI